MNAPTLEQVKRIISANFTQVITAISLGQKSEKDYERVKDIALDMQKKTVEEVVLILK